MLISNTRKVNIFKLYSLCQWCCNNFKMGHFQNDFQTNQNEETHSLLYKKGKKLAVRLLFTCVFVQMMVVPHDCFSFFWFDHEVAFVTILREITLPSFSSLPGLKMTDEHAINYVICRSIANDSRQLNSFLPRPLALSSRARVNEEVTNIQTIPLV